MFIKSLLSQHGHPYYCEEDRCPKDACSENPSSHRTMHPGPCLAEAWRMGLLLQNRSLSFLQPQPDLFVTLDYFPYTWHLAAAPSIARIPREYCCGTKRKYHFLSVPAFTGPARMHLYCLQTWHFKTNEKGPEWQTRHIQWAGHLQGNGCKENRYFMNIHWSVNLHIAHTLFCILICPWMQMSPV